MPGPRTRLALVLLALSALLHFYRLAEPRRIVFDEVHFGGFVSSYVGDHRYFFDIHPPHAKLVVAGVAALGGYRGEQVFEGLGDPIDAVSPALLRAAPAAAGTLLPPLIFVLLLQLGARPMAAFLGGWFVLLDNALLLQTRVIALDGILLLALFGSLCALLAGMAAPTRLRRTGWALACGALAGLAVGSKFTGLAVFPLLAVCLARPLVPRPSWAALRGALGTSAWLLAGAVAVYAAGWALHFHLLDQPGPGHAWAVPTGDWLVDTVHAHRRMLASNYGLTSGHAYASSWWTWPLMLRPIYYWTQGSAALYFLGNPVVWWGVAFGLALLLSTTGLMRVSDLRAPAAVSPRARWLWLPLLGYLVALAPLVRIPRALFLYHYLTALLFSLCAVILWLDQIGFTRSGGWRRQRGSYYALAIAVGLGFVAISPFSFAFVVAPTYREWVFGIFPGWR
jgi:dolichyl-phosphate-mannose-protein mannosyltransferase